MSNKTQLATNNTQLASLIQTLQGKAAGGGGASLDTCTVNFSGFTAGSDDGYPVLFQTVENGEVVIKSENGSALRSVTMLCNGLLICGVDSFVSNVTVTGNISTIIDNSVYGGQFNLLAAIPNLSSGETGTIAVRTGGYD
jgi:hypothetical protein